MTSPKRVFLAGEGANELGDWHGEAQYRTPVAKRRQKQGPRPGVLEALLRKVSAGAWTIEGAVCWKDIPKLRVNHPGRHDGDHVRRAALHAREAGCNVLAFSRDRDGPKYDDRRVQVEAAIDEESAAARPLAIAGGVAIEKLEAWILACMGHHGSEQQLHPERVLAEKYGIEPKHTGQFVAAVQAADLDQLPRDAASLHTWIARARAALE